MSSQVTAPLPPKARPPRDDEHSSRERGNGSASSNGHGPDEHDHDEVDLNVPRPKPLWVVIVGVVGVLVLAALLVTGLLPRMHTSKELAADAQTALNAPVPVNVVTPRTADATMKVLLPGTLRPWQEVSLYARSTGYLKKFFVDISNQVTKGQLMADIESPEVDQQLRAAQATLLQQEAAANKAKTDLAYAETTDKRYESLRGTSGVTQTELDLYKSNFDSASANLKSAEANVAVAQANVQRLMEMQSFEKLTAPFAGVVTGRAYDVGALIIANPTMTEANPLFKLAENDVLRAFVNVPQNYALTIEKGMKVTVTARERAGRDFTGTVLGTTNYLDPAMRSLLTEVRIENPDFALLPGMFVTAQFEVVRNHPPLIIPAPALVINADGRFVGVVKNNKVHFQKVDLGVDFGNDVEILSGLTADDQVIGNPGEKTIEGAEVAVAGDKKTEAPQQGLKEHGDKVAEVGK